MEHLKKVINQYLTLNTNYAIMITGDWGIGKTFFFNNVLKQKISNTETKFDSSKKYKTVHISLFGIKSIEEIQTEIFLCLYPILKSSKFKLGASIGKSLIKGFLHLKGVGEYAKYIEDVNLTSKNVINFNELVLCFDDFERISRQLNLEEVVGYINSLVELENTKIIIIANENKIDNEKYSILKEKVVGNTIEFLPSIEDSIKSIIQNRYISDNVYKEFALNNIDLITEITKNNKNLRTVIFALDYFQYVFSEIELNITSNKILLEKKEEILLYLLRFTLAISFEYKDSKITYKKRNQLDNSNFRALFWQLEKNKDKQKELTNSYRVKFEEKYFTKDNANYVFYESIYAYITGANIFEYQLLFEELKKIYNIVNGEIPPHYIIFNQLTGRNVYELSEKEYLESLKRLLNFADQGLYKISDYLTIFHLVSRYNNPLKLNLNTFVRRLKKGINKSLIDHIPIDGIQMYLIINQDNDYKEHLMELREYIIKNNYILLDKIKNNEKNILIDLFYINTADFIRKIMNDEKYLFTPLFNDFNPNSFFKLYNHSTNQIKFKLIEFFQYYCYNLYGDDVKSELVFFKRINQLTKEKILKSKKAGLTYFLQNEFYNTTKEIIKKLS